MDADSSSQVEWKSQTDPEYWGWAWHFAMPSEDIDWRQTWSERQRVWLDQWQPPEVWKQ